MNRVVHFEIPASNPQATQAFYESVFGWKFNQWGDMPYWLITTGDEATGINGGMMPQKDPTQPVVCTVDVADLDATCVAVEAAGGTVVVPKMPIPTVGWLAYFKGPDGYIFGVMQPDEAAA